MSFSEYLAKRRINHNQSGAFTLQAREDRAMAEIKSWTALQAYLFHRYGAKAKEAIDAAEPVWRGYRAHVLKSRRPK